MTSRVTASAFRVPSETVPQAPIGETRARLRALRQGTATVPSSASERRRIAYQVHALRVLGWVTPDSPARLTEAGAHVAVDDDAAFQRAFTEAFVATPVMQAWKAWARAENVQGLEPSGVERFLRDCASVSEATAKRRATTLRAWLRFVVGQGRKRPKRRRRTLHGQLSLPDGRDHPTVRGRIRELPWPAADRFPHNAGDRRTGSVLAEDIRSSTSVTLVAGYGCVAELVELLANPGTAHVELRVLFGAEPRVYGSGVRGRRHRNLADEVRDYWLDRGISPARSGHVLAARDRLRQGSGVSVRLGPTEPRIHAKVYATDRSVIIGSSNYTSPGLRSQLEANVRLVPADGPRFDEARTFADSLWELGTDFRDELAALLDALLVRSTWEEALARACAALLEGEWLRTSYRAAVEIDALEPPMWPHQRRALAQAEWVLRNVGGVLVADAAGSGKTRTGAWTIRRAYDLQISRQHASPREIPVVVSPPGVRDAWADALAEAKLSLPVESQGALSRRPGLGPTAGSRRIEATELLAVDEAHNYVRRASQRHQLLRMHQADQVILLTATPINRTASDLISMVELLGPDNFSDESLEVFRKLQRQRSRIGKTSENADELDRIRDELATFLVRRTRSRLNAIVDEAPELYRLSPDRIARYPRLAARFYDCSASEADLIRVTKIRELAATLHGVHRLPQHLDRPRHFDGSANAYVNAVARAAAGLARYHLLASMRSSKAALLEHIAGTAAACETLGIDASAIEKSDSGNVLETTRRGRRRPTARRDHAEPGHLPSWLRGDEDFRDAIAHDVQTYEAILAEARELSETREEQKAAQLVEIAGEHARPVIGFAAHIITLHAIGRHLPESPRVDVFTGAKGATMKKKAEQLLGRSATEPVIALCSDALNEGLNLQGATAVVHLDTPTVVRVAEQRAGRVDRMNSPYDAVSIFWPKDPPEYAVRRRDLLEERHLTVKALIGANLQLPDDVPESPVEPEELARHVHAAEESELDAIADAFAPVRQLIGSDGVISADTYEGMRTSRARVRSFVATVQSEVPWAFFVVGDASKTTGRWVAFDSPDSEPIVDLRELSTFLRTRLPAPNAAEPPLEASTFWLERFLASLDRSREKLLPRRRQRVLDLAEKVLSHYAGAASSVDSALREVSADVLLGLHPTTSADDESAGYELRAFTDAFLALLRPYRIARYESVRGRNNIFRLQHLEKDLMEKPLDAEELRRACEDLPTEAAIDRRVIVTIVGVPQQP